MIPVEFIHIRLSSKCKLFALFGYFSLHLLYHEGIEADTNYVDICYLVMVK